MFSNPNNDFSVTPWELSEDKTELKLKTTEDILVSYKELFTKIFGNDLNLEPSTPQGQIITALVESDVNTLNLIQNLANAIMFGGSGIYLDKWAFNLFRAIRKTGTPSSVNVTIYGNPRVIVPSGFTVSDGNLNYKIDNDLEIPSSGEISATFICTEISDSVSLINTINQIVTPVIGVNRVNNLSPSTEAIPTESDSSLFKRCISYGSLSSNATLDSLLSEISQINNVLKVNGYENSLSQSVTFKGTLFERHSFGLVILGGDNEEIAKTIQRLKPPGPTMMGDVEVEIPVDNLQAYNKEYNVTYRFYRPTNVPLQFSASVKLFNYTPANYQELLKKAIMKFIEESKIGSIINVNDIVNYVFNYCGPIFLIEQLELSKKSEVLSQSDIDLQFLEMAVVEIDDIIVTGN